MCDQGREVKHEVNENRVIESLVNKINKTTGEALKSLLELLNSYENKLNKVAIVINAHQSTENSFAIKYFFSKYFNIKNFYIGTKEDGEFDDILIEADKNPNRKGVMLTVGESLKDGITSDLSKYELVIQFGSEVTEDFDESKFKNIKHFVVFGTNKNSVTDLAEILIPIKSFAEQSGSFINEDGRMQRFYPMVNTKTHMPSVNGVVEVVNERANLLEVYKLITELSKLSDFDLRFDTIFDIMNLMKKDLKTFKDFKYSSLGKNGLVIEEL